MLQWLLRSYIQQAATQKLHEAAAEMLRDHQSSADGAVPAEQAGDWPPCDVAVVYALSVELGGFEDRMSKVRKVQGKGFVVRFGEFQGRNISLVETGPGRQAAAQATAAMIAGHRPQWIVSSGFAGGLAPELKRGDFVMANDMADVGGGHLAVDFHISPEALKATPHVHVGRMLTVDKIIRTKAEKLELGQTHNALAVEMESYAVAEVCRREKVRFMAVRVISDTTEDELPVEVEKLLGMKSTAGRLGAALGALVQRPSSALDMWQLKEDAIVASDRLAKFLSGVIVQLAPARKPAT